MQSSKQVSLVLNGADQPTFTILHNRDLRGMSGIALLHKGAANMPRTSPWAKILLPLPSCSMPSSLPPRSQARTTTFNGRGDLRDWWRKLELVYDAKQLSAQGRLAWTRAILQDGALRVATQWNPATCDALMDILSRRCTDGNDACHVRAALADLRQTSGTGTYVERFLDIHSRVPNLATPRPTEPEPNHRQPLAAQFGDHLLVEFAFARPFGEPSEKLRISEPVSVCRSSIALCSLY